MEEHSVLCQQIKNKYLITTINLPAIVFSLTKLEYQMLMEVKEAINRNAVWHGLEVEE